MTTLLLVALVAADVFILVTLLRLKSRGDSAIEVALDMTEERRLLGELRQSVKEDLALAEAKARETLDKATKLAFEAEMEVKTGAQTITTELDQMVSQVAARLDEPVKEVGKKTQALDALLRRADKEKALLQGLIARGEKLAKFFDDKVPYQEVLEEIEDKKYQDARRLLAKGTSPRAVAQELNMSESEVRLVLGLA